MADLENLLLQAAGRTGTSGRKNNHSRPQSRWRREGSYSDGSDSKDDDSDNPRYNKRKPAGSQVPLKKRLDPPEKDKRSGWGDDDDDDDDRHDDDDESDSAPSVGSDLYRDEADKEELGKMSELDRELILAERSIKIDDYKLKKMARASSAKMEKSRKESPPPFPYRSRSSVRTDRTAAKSALDELRAKRLKQQAPEGYRNRFKDAVGDGGSGGAGHQDMSPPKHRSAAASPPSDLSNEHESGSRMDSEDERFLGNNKMEDDFLDDSPSRLDPLKFEDFKEITIRRSKLVKWFREPFFEELIVGCFVRVQVGSRSGARYKLFFVRNVDATDPSRHYKLAHHTTYKMLNLTWGNMSVKYEMAYVSDSPALEKEFKEWQHEVEKSGGRMPTRQDVHDKKEAIQKINNFVYSAATVKQMLQEKKSASGRPVNVAAEKDRLRKEMEVAESRRDEAEVERIRARLKELEDMSRQAEQKDAKAVRLAEMNRKNRAENFKNASELKPVNPSLKAGEAGYDPFSRRWTRSSNYFLSKPGGDGNAAAGNGDNGSATMCNGDAGVVGPLNGVEAGVAATAAALEAAAGAGKLVDTSAPVDQGTESNTLHDFDLPISLAALQKFGGPQAVHLNFMSRKQKIEATTGYKVPDYDGRRHALTLTVSDYKRRRGLL